MAFGRKKNVEMNYNQSNVSELASAALRKMRATRVRLPMRLTFETPILTQRWTTKAVRKMLGNMVGMPEPKENKDLTKDYEDSWYRNKKGDPVIPCRIVKAAVVEAAVATAGVVTKADLKRSMRVLGYTAPIREAKKEMDVKIVRNSNGQPDVRSRALFEPGCYIDVVLEFGMPLSPDQIVAAADAAGNAIGLCEWRPEKGGDFGTFTVAPLPSDAATVNRILKECSIPEDEFVIPPEMLQAFNAIPTEKLNEGGKKVRALHEHQQSQQAKANGKAKNNDASADAE